MKRNIQLARCLFVACALHPRSVEEAPSYIRDVLKMDDYTSLCSCNDPKGFQQAGEFAYCGSNCTAKYGLHVYTGRVTTLCRPYKCMPTSHANLRNHIMNDALKFELTKGYKQQVNPWTWIRTCRADWPCTLRFCYMLWSENVHDRLEHGLDHGLQQCWFADWFVAEVHFQQTNLCPNRVASIQHSTKCKKTGQTCSGPLSKPLKDRHE